MKAEPSAADLLWGRAAPRSRGPRPELSAAGIADAGIGIADADGLAAVTMQRVAHRLGCTAMALYRHVPGRAEMIALMIDTALGAAPAVDVASGWQPALRAWTHAIYGVFRRHPWLAEATMRARPVGPRELSWLERAVDALSGTALTGPQRVDAALVLVGHVRGQVQAEAGIAAAGGRELAAGLVRDLAEHADDYPALTAAAADGAFGPQDGGGFEFGLTCILDGIAARAA